MHTTCSSCAAPMTCGVIEKSCWCRALPALPASQYCPDKACLCGNCLQNQLDAGVVVYGIANCDTVKKARAWLTQQGVDYAFWDYKKHGVPAGKLSHWLGALGWQRVVNTRGTAWRQLPASTQASVVDAPTAAPVLLASPSVIKRPIVAWGNTYAQTLTVGFDEDIWQGIIKI